mmetsp:Transcript_70625/g.154009  ORF Transcript_70625/g.154009 Transcript_70625/m.154009 type:complete len:221 (+) Transcript_70625:1569-2231(+)
MPRLEIGSARALALAPTLHHEAHSFVEVSEHGDQSIAVTVRAANVASLGSHIRHRQAQASSRLGDQGTTLEGVVDAVNTVLFHGQQEAGRHLGSRGACVEQGRGGMRKGSAGEKIIGLQRSLQIVEVDAARHSHQHVLRSLQNFVVYPEQIRLFEGFEAEVVIVIVALVVDGGIQFLAVGLHELPHARRNDACWPPLSIAMVMKGAASVHERVRSALVEV